MRRTSYKKSFCEFTGSSAASGILAGWWHGCSKLRTMPLWITSGHPDRHRETPAGLASNLESVHPDLSIESTDGTAEVTEAPRAFAQ